MTSGEREIDTLGSDDKRARLAALLRRRAGRDESAHPLAHGQQALWFLHQLVPGTAAYNVVFSARVRSPLDIGALARALRELVTRHPILRATFEAKDGRPLQRLRPVTDVPVDEVDASASSPASLASVLTEAAQRPFDLTDGPLVRAAVFTRAADDRVLVLAVHHLVVDGWSFGLLLDDLFQLYAAEVTGAPSPTTSAPQYLDFVRWQSEMLASAQGTALRAYWDEALSGELPVLDLPTDRPRPPVVSLRGASVRFVLDAALTTDIKRLAVAEGTTPFVVMLTGLQALLARYTGQTDIVVGSPVAGRTRAAFERVVGNCMNMVVLRGNLSDDPTFRALVGRLRERVLGALAHQDYPFPLIVEDRKAARDLSRMPVFQVTFNYLRLQTASGVAALLAQEEGTPGVTVAGLRLESCPVPQQEGQFDLALEMTEVGDQLHGRLKYDSALFDESTIAAMAGHYDVLLRGAVQTPERAVSALPLLTVAERQRLVVEWNDTARPYPLERGLHELIEAQVARTPERIAVELDTRQLTYRELDARANQLARRLKAHGAGRDVLVGVCMERSLELVVALLGILKAGAAYVPLDPGYPVDRLAFMTHDAGASIIVTQPHLQAVLPKSGATLILLDPSWSALSSERSESMRLGIGGDALAYMIYTSGSTGRPKGALNTHRGIVNRLLWMQDTYGLGEDDRVLQKTPFSFDVSVWEFFWPLLTGARLVLARPEGHKDPRYLIDVITAHAITTAHFVPSMLRAFLDDPDVARCTSLRRVIASGEALPAELVERFFARLPAELHNLYGPTEAAVDVTAWACHRGERRRTIPIGRPIANTRIHILDGRGEPVPVGVAGELHIGGVQVGRGYLGRPDLTTEKFVPDPFAHDRQARLYRTGDLARCRPGGEIEYLGRLDHQIKLRGFRIELGEIEAALTSHASVREAIVVASESLAGGMRLIGFVTAAAGQTLDVAVLQAHLRASLPEYMVPSALVALDVLPLLPNGKVDRRALPLPDVGQPESTEEYVAPRTELERAVAEIWADVLKIERVGARAHFFALGGHSLLATRVMTRIRSALAVELPLRALFEAPTVAALAAEIQTATRVEASTSALPPTPVVRTRPAPASFVQRRMWFFDQVSPGSAAYNIPLLLELSGPLDRAVLERALTLLLERHAVLRTTLRVVDGDVVQVEGPALPPLRMLDFSELHAAAREAAVRRQTATEARAPFDLGRGPLLRTTLLRLGPQSHLLTVTAHHAVLDGWSIALFVRELAEAYAALSEARPPRLAALPIQYADFAEWQRRWLTDGTLAPQLAYWRRQLAGAPELLDLPADRPHPPAPTFEASVCSRVVAPAVAGGLRGLSQREGATMFMTVLGAFLTLLFRYTGQDDLVVGSPIAGRNQPGTDELVGVFINTLVLRTDVSGDPTFRQLLGRVREVTLGAYAHQDVPFERLVEELRPGRHPDRNPLFQVLFNLLNFASSFDADGGGIRFSVQPSLDLAAAAESLTLYAFDGTDGLHLWLVYSRERFDAATAERILGHFETLLRGVVDDPDRRLSALPMLGAEEQRRLLREWNDTDTPFPLEETFARQFEAQVARTPHAIAAVSDDGTLTYAALDLRATRLANRLSADGIGPEHVVALLGERSLDFLTWMLAVFKAGAAYLPLDPRHPAVRHATILSGSGAVLVLVDDDHAPTLEAALAELDVAARPVTLSASEIHALGDSAEAVGPRGHPSDLAYVIYTSGSTGVPKGAMVEQVGMLNHLHAKIRDLALTAADSVAQTASQCFDISVWQFLAPLLVGGRVRIVGDEIAHDAPRLLELLDRDGISIVEVVPSVLASAFPDARVDTASGPVLDGLRWLIVTGEAAPSGLCRRWLQAYPRTALLNGYGPTECSDDVTHHALTEAPAADATQIPIGRPIANMRIYVVDRALNLTPIGVPGELCVGGIGVGRGYLGDPARTAEAFISDPFTSRPGARLYRTGDLARWRADGTLEFLGRLDYQVKVRGFRIELGEIESVLMRHPAVRETVVVARETDRGGRRLVAYVVTREETAESIDLRSFLARTLPDYMLPESIVTLPALPLTPNGKVDRRALPEPELPARPLASTPPRTPTEEVIVNVWTEVLGLERVGVHENFFELGGHSLLATRVVSRLRKAFAIELPVRRLFEAPTVAELGTHVDAARAGTAATAPPLRARPRTSAPLLSFAQQRLWFFDQLEPGTAVYNMPLVLSLRGRLDVEALQVSLTEIARRHESLRSRFPSKDGVALLRTAPPAPWPLSVVDLSDVPAERREAEAERLAIQEASRPFDLAAGPLARARLLRLDHDRHLLVVTLHHIIVDGWGLDLFMQELAALYGAQLAGQAPRLPALPVQYSDFAAWQRELLEGETSTQQLAYWTRQLAGAPAALELPLDQARPVIQTFRGGGCTRRIDPPVRDALHALGRRADATLFMTLLAAFGVLLGRQSGQDDVCIGVPVAGRVRAELENLIGLFVNTLVFRVRLDGSPRFRALLDQVRETALGAYANQDIPFEKLVEELQPPRDLGRTPLFQVMLNMLNFGEAKSVELPGLQVEPGLRSSQQWNVQSKFDLTLYARDEPAGITLTAVYNADLFADDRMADLLDQLVQLLTAIAADPDVDVGTTGLLTAAAARVLPDPTTPLSAVWTEPVATRFSRHARRTPQRAAVVTATRTWSYGELEAGSNQLARYLSGHGVGRGDLVAIYADRSAGLAWALLGIMKAGAAFVCLDAAYPAARTVACLQAAPPRALVHLEGAGPLPEAIRDHLAGLDGLLTLTWPARSGAARQGWSANPTDTFVRDVGPDDLAYVAFTSGSTGIPRAIAGGHGPLTHFVEWHRRTSGLDERDRFAALSGLAHDPLLRDILGAFWVGAPVYLPDHAWMETPGYLERWLREQRISVAHVTPGVASLFTEGLDHPDARPLPSLRHVFFGGDVLTAPLVDRVRRVAPQARCVNFYGATETPQAVAWYRVPEPAPSRATIPVGQGIDGAQLLVLNAAGELAGIGELGEIHVRTPNLSRGYLNDPETTAERFVINPFTKAPDDRVYRTGDLGRYRPDGAVEFVGRRDGQVKIRGLRVELGDVEAALRRCPGIEAAVVRVRDETGANAQLVAYVVGADGSSPAPEQLRAWLGRELPITMVPSTFIALPRLPLTPNGKVDVAQLPAPPPPTVRQRLAPRTATEATLAQIWRDVLGTEAVDVEANFFELGGHSLLAVRLFSRIENAFGVTLPLATLFQAPTLGRQAELIDQRGGSAPWRALVPIQPAGSRPPLYAVPGLGGIVVAFKDLATLLGPDQPFYGLQPRGLDGKLPPFTTVEEMAEHYIGEIRALQPEGPYHLIGSCMGGVVAFEMAQRLHAAGQRVAFLALLDVRPPHPLMRWTPTSRGLRAGAILRLLISRLAAYTRSLWRRPSRELVREIFDRLRHLGTQVSTGDPLRGARGELYREMVTAANASAMQHYVPVEYPGSLLLVLAADRKYARGKDRRLAWRDLAAGGVDICVAPGEDSGLLLVQPNVLTLAEEFRARLAQARSGEPRLETSGEERQR